MNASMSELKQVFENAGFADVRTVLGSGNVVFNAREKSCAAIERKAEAQMKKDLGRAFLTIVRSNDDLAKLMKADPFKAYKIPGSAKKVVTFLRSTPSAWPEFPIEKDGAVVAGAQGSHVFTHYVAHPKGPTFMVLIEKLFGTEVTTRTWGTVRKCAIA